MPTSTPALPTLREVIDAHLNAADPHVLTAHDRLDTPVEWVHSSEIFEIGPLLAGGELLLTTGLGLAGLDAGTRRHYVADLADRGVAGLAFETGRSFDAVPEEMISEGSRRRLPIIELRRIVPFIVVCRAANTALVSDEVGQWRARAALDSALHDDLVGGGIAAMLGHIADAVAGPVVLIDSSGALLAAHGVDDDRAAWRLVDDARGSVAIEARGREVGRLIAGPSDGSTLSPDSLHALLSLAAGPIGSALKRSDSRGVVAGAQLLDDLLASRPLRRADLAARLGNSGIGLTSSTTLVPVAAASPDARMASASLTGAATSLGAGIVHGVVDATAYAVLAVPDNTLEAGDDPVGHVAAELDRAGARSGRVTIAVGDVISVSDAAHGPGLALALGHGLRSAAEQLAIAMDLARRGAVRGHVFTARQLAADAAVRHLPAEQRSDLVELIGPLVDHDRAASTQLVATIDAHLRHGCSATRSAQALHIGRQSLYQRLERIRTLLGFDPAAPEVYASILLAVSAFHADQR